MLYLFFGENDYLIKQAVKNLSQAFFETNPVRSSLSNGVKLLDFTDLSREISELKSLPDVLSQQSLFAEKMLFVLQGFLKNADKKELDNLLSFLQEVPNSMNTNLVFWEERLDQRLKIVKWLKENAEVREFGQLRKGEVKKWIMETMEQWNNGTMEQSAVEELIRLHGGNLWALQNEIAKLTSYTQGREITLADVKKLCVPSVEENIFNFTDAIAVRDKKKTSELFTNLLTQQQDPWYLFAMIVRQFRLLILMKSSGNLTKQHPFVVQKTKSQVRYWELSELKEIYQRLLDIDVACKTGKGDLTTEISLLIAQL